MAAVVITTMLQMCPRCEHLDPDIDPECERCAGTGLGLAVIFYQLEWGETMRTNSWIDI